MTTPLHPCSNCSKLCFMACRSPHASLGWISRNLALDALASPCPRTRRYPTVVGKLRLNGEMSLPATRQPRRFDRESHCKRRKPMVEAWRELSATMVIEGSQVISGNCCAWYNLLGSLATALGALSGGALVHALHAAGRTLLQSYQMVPLVYAGLGVVLGAVI